MVPNQTASVGQMWFPKQGDAQCLRHIGKDGVPLPRDLGASVVGALAPKANS